MSGRIDVAWLVVMLSVVCSLGCQPRGVIVVSKEKPQGIAVVDRYSGNDPGLREPVLLLINSGEELEALGSFELATHGVDFGRQSLLLLALGEKPTGGYWARITGVQQEGDLLYVQALANRPGDDQAVKQVLTYPYDAVVIPKVTRVTVRSEVDSLVGKHPQEYRFK